MPYFTATYRAANDPEHRRWRAEEARSLADTFVHPRAREHMLSVAASFDRLAELAEKNRLQAVDEASRS